jgi:hypothetical protein
MPSHSQASGTRYWIGVASYEHVRRGSEGGFAQLGHGREAPIRRMREGDWLIYYSPAESLGGKEPLQSFTAIGQVAAGEPWLEQMSADFKAFRRRVDYLPSTPAPIRPLLDTLTFIPDPKKWGSAFRWGQLEIGEPDFRRVAEAMGAELPG